MKTITRAGVVALLTTVLFAGCFIPIDRGAGQVGIQLPTPRGTDGSDPADFARVYVLNGPTLLRVGTSSDWEEFDLQPDDGTEVTEVTVGPVPAGSGYRIVIAFGDYLDGAAGNQAFVPVEYAVSGEFAVYAGQANVADVTVASSPFLPLAISDTLGRELRGIVFDGARAHVATSETLYSTDLASPLTAFDFADFASGTATLSFPDTYAPVDRTINSISLGATDDIDGSDANAPTVWVNTTRGILPLDGSGGPGTRTLNDAFDVSSLGEEFSVQEYSILDSGGYLLGNDVYGYVQFEGGLSGVWDPDTSTFEQQWLVPIDLSEFVVGIPILDLAVYNDGTSVDALVASKLGAFRMSQEVLDPANQVYTVEELFNYSDFFEISIDGTKATITQIAVGDQNDTVLYLGTPRGAVRIPDLTQIGQTLQLTGTLVPHTSNQIVEDIVMLDDYVVVLTNHFLVYSNDGGENWSSVPVYAGSVGRASGMLVIPNGIVVLAGENGLAGIDIN